MQQGMPAGGEWLPANTGPFESGETSPETPHDQSPPAASPAGSAKAGSSPAPAAAASGPTSSRFSRLFAAMLVAGAVGGLAGSTATAVVLGRGALIPTTLAPRTVTAAPQPASYAAALPDNGIKSIYKQVSPAVVSVETSVAGRQRRSTIPGFPNTPGSPNGGQQGTPRSPSTPQLMPEGEGAGFIVDDQGHILTNYHVVQGADRITVVLLDGTQVPAQLVGSDPGSDLAVLQASLPAGKYAVATLGDSDAIEPGDTAIAIGTPFGFDHSVTAGIISGVNRDFGQTVNGRPMHGLIQTDAPINPGNSGGPLLDAAGEVIGITTSIESPVRGSVGIGFAIPINQAKRLLPQLEAGKQVQHAWLGIAGVALTPDAASSLGLPSGITQGVVVMEVSPNSPAASAGLRGSSSTSPTAPAGANVIVAVDGRAVSKVEDIAGYLDTKSPGDTVTLTIYRGGQKQDVRVTLAPWPASQPS